jgi:hypothetical protein
VAEEAMEEVMHVAAKVAVGKMNAVAARKAVEAVATASHIGKAAAKTGPLPIVYAKLLDYVGPFCDGHINMYSI